MSEAKDNPVPATTTATVETLDSSGTVRRQSLTTQNEFGNSPQGVQANIWAKLGMLAAVTIFFGAAMMWMMHAVNSQVDLLREELTEARKAAALERKDMTDRYLASRESQEKRHQETLAKLDKVMLFVELSFAHYLKSGQKVEGKAKDAPKASEMVP